MHLLEQKSLLPSEGFGAIQYVAKNVHNVAAGVVFAASFLSLAVSIVSNWKLNSGTGGRTYLERTATPGNSANDGIESPVRVRVPQSESLLDRGIIAVILNLDDVVCVILSVFESADIKWVVAMAPGKDPSFVAGMKSGILIEAGEELHNVASRIETSLHALGPDGFDRSMVKYPGYIIGQILNETLPGTNLHG